MGIMPWFGLKSTTSADFPDEYDVETGVDNFSFIGGARYSFGVVNAHGIDNLNQTHYTISVHDAMGTRYNDSP